MKTFKDLVAEQSTEALIESVRAYVAECAPHKADILNELCTRLCALNYMVEATVDGRQPDLFPLEDSLDDD